MVTIFNNLNLSQFQNLSERNIQQILKIGQVLNTNIEKVDGNQIQMRLGNLTLNASSTNPNLSTGPAKIEILQTQPQLVVSIVKPESAPPSTTASLEKSIQQLIQNALRQFLPNQTPLGQTFQQLSLLTNLPPNLQAPLQQLLDQLKKSSQNLDGKNLKAAIDNSGIFMESKLNPKTATPKSNLQQDLKAQLLQLQQQTQSSQSASPQVKQLNEALIQAINRITYQQLQSLEQLWGFQTQRLNYDAQPMVEEQYTFKRNQTQQGAWQVWLQLELPQGALQAKISLSKNTQEVQTTKTLHCTLWCENLELEAQMQSQQQSLLDKLRMLDLDKVDLFFSEQPIVFQQELANRNERINLIDIQI